MQKQVGHRIRELREARGLTQEHLAEKAGINGKYFGAIERGEVNLTLSSIEKICRTLDVPPGNLFQDQDAGKRTDSEEILRLVKSIIKQGDKGKAKRLRVFLERVFR